METFTFNNIVSDTKGIIVKKMPPITSPKRSIDSIKVDGRNGTLHIDNATYEAYNVTIQCVVTDLTKINEIKAWLTGIGKVEFSNNADIEYDCVVKNQIPFNSYLTVLKEFPLQLEINPIGHSKTETVVTKTTFPATFDVEGTIGVKPTIEVKGTGTATITINNVAFSLTELNTTATIVDCDLMNVIKGGTQANDKFSGVFPSLEIGENTISIVGTVSEIKIKYKEGWL